MDNADVDAVLQNYQQGPTPTKMMWFNGDFNGDEAVGEDDLQIVEPALPASLVAYWRLDEGSGTTACNSASGSDNITIRSATWDAAFSKFGGCLAFDVAASNVSVPSTTDLNITTQISLACWASVVQPPDGSVGTLISKGGAYSLSISVDANGAASLQFQATINGTQRRSATRWRTSPASNSTVGTSTPRPTTARTCNCMSTARPAAAR